MLGRGSRIATNTSQRDRFIGFVICDDDRRAEPDPGRDPMSADREQGLTRDLLDPRF